MSNPCEFSSIDSVDLARVTGGAEEGNWEAGLGRAGQAIGATAGGILGTVGGAIGIGVGGYAGSELVGAYGRQLGRAIDNPQPGPTGGVNGVNGPEQMTP